MTMTFKDVYRELEAYEQYTEHLDVHNTYDLEYMDQCWLDVVQAVPERLLQAVLNARLSDIQYFGMIQQAINGHARGTRGWMRGLAFIGIYERDQTEAKKELLNLLA